jgi:hypothetical protein
MTRRNTLLKIDSDPLSAEFPDLRLQYPKMKVSIG